MNNKVSPRLGIFGEFGCGNLGNQGSLDAMLKRLRERHPDYELTGIFRCPDRSMERFGIPAVSLTFPRRGSTMLSWLYALTVSAPGKIVDLLRMIVLAGRFDVVLIPGTGIWEEANGAKPWGMPWALMTLAIAATLRRTKVAFVAVGANDITDRRTRWLIRWVARHASYVSVRDDCSRDALIGLGVPLRPESVYRDLAYALPAADGSAYSEADSEPDTTTTRTVGVGVISYHGSFPGTPAGNVIQHRYNDQIVDFVTWLVDHGYRVRLLTGDSADQPVADEVRQAVVDRRTDARDLVEARPSLTLEDVMQQMMGTSVVVASRYHNLIAAAMLAKPVISVGYGAKSFRMMDRLGLSGYCQHIDDVSCDKLIEQFEAIRNDQSAVTTRLLTDLAASEGLIEAQFADLDSFLSS